MIAPHIFVISLVLSILWGWHVVDEINDYRELRVSNLRSRAQVGHSFRALICAICLESICFAYVFRTGVVLMGLGDQVASQIVFFTILGINIPGAIFAVVSRRFD